MPKMTKRLKEYVQTLSFLGSVTLAGGAYGASILLSSKHPEDWSPYYFYFKAAGAIFGYVLESRWNPGARVTLHFDKSTYSEDEKTLDSLVMKYRSNTLMVLPLVLYVTADFIISRMHAQTHAGTLEGYAGSVIIGAGITIITTMGIKYLSAWWNIKKHWQKEFHP
jgi:hypothetical protein